MKIKAISHIGFNCKNLEESIKFYCNILGCKEKFFLTYGDMVAELEKKFAGKQEPPFLNKLRAFSDKKWIVYLQWTDNSFIELFYQIGAVNERIPQKDDLNYTHYSLEVDDIREFKAEVIKNGGEKYLDTDISLDIDNTWQMWMHDPDGNKFEIMEYTANSYQVAGRR